MTSEYGLRSPAATTTSKLLTTHSKYATLRVKARGKGRARGERVQQGAMRKQHTARTAGHGRAAHLDSRESTVRQAAANSSPCWGVRRSSA